jgi:hypothetical protein
MQLVPDVATSQVESHHRIVLDIDIEDDSAIEVDRRADNGELRTSSISFPRVRESGLK